MGDPLPIDFLQDSLNFDLLSHSTTTPSNSPLDLYSSPNSSVLSINDYQKPFDGAIVTSLKLPNTPVLSVQACSACYRSKRTCDRNRPCQRCIDRKKPYLCTDRPIIMRKRKKSSSTNTKKKRDKTSLVLSETKEDEPLTPLTYPSLVPSSGQLCEVKTAFLQESKLSQWADLWVRALEVNIERMSYLPHWETSKLVCKSIAATPGDASRMACLWMNLCDLIEKKKPRHLVSTLPVSQISPLPLRYGLMSEEMIGERYQPTIVFECLIINGEEDYILFNLGVNTEAERLFGYSRQELFNIYRQKRKECLARIIERPYWEKVIAGEMKAYASGEGGFRLFTTCVNKWRCPIKVLLDTRFEDNNNAPSKLRHRYRMNFFFIPLPEAEIEL